MSSAYRQIASAGIRDLGFPKDRTAASAACAVIACGLGAQIVRVHDVAETRDELLVLSAIEKAAARLVH